MVYATNNKVLYRVDDLFDFRGFVGVYSVLDGQPVYMYVNDGDVIDDNKGLIGACTGTVKDFTRELALENTITVTPSKNRSCRPRKPIYLRRKRRCTKRCI